MRKNGFYASICLPVRRPSFCLSVDTITFERIKGLDCVFAHFFRAKKERTSSFASHFGQKFKKLYFENRFFFNLKLLCTVFGSTQKAEQFIFMTFFDQHKIQRDITFIKLEKKFKFQAK